MCGRFAVGDTDGQDWADWLALDPELDWPPDGWPTANWNIAPTQQVGMVIQGPGGRRAGPARWGLVPHWWTKPLSEFRMTTFNARSEEAAEKPMFRDSWARRRCLIPAIGWYEWSGEKGAKTPFFITMRRNTPGFWFAGLWSSVTLDGTRIVSCTVLTTSAGEATRHLHPRTPVVLDEDEATAWLALEEGAGLMHAPDDERVELWEVDRKVGQVRNNGPELIEPVHAEPAS